MLLFSWCTVAETDDLQGKLFTMLLLLAFRGEPTGSTSNLSPYLCLICINRRHILTTSIGSLLRTHVFPFTHLYSEHDFVHKH